VRGQIAGGLVALQVDGEPALRSSNQRQPGYPLGPYRLQRVLDLGDGNFVVERSPRVALKRAQVGWLIEQGVAESLLESDVYGLRGMPPDVEWNRALLRFDFSDGGTFGGGWSDLGLDHRGCVPLAELGPMQVERTTRFRIGWDPGVGTPEVSWDLLSLIDGTATDLIVIRLEDDYGISEIGASIESRRNAEAPQLAVKVMGPDEGIGPTTLTIVGPADAVMCHKH
jgi:hypothetical protein